MSRVIKDAPEAVKIIGTLLLGLLIIAALIVLGAIGLYWAMGEQLH